MTAQNQQSFRHLSEIVRKAEPPAPPTLSKRRKAIYTPDQQIYDGFKQMLDLLTQDGAAVAVREADGYTISPKGRGNRVLEKRSVVLEVQGVRREHPAQENLHLGLFLDRDLTDIHVPTEKEKVVEILMASGKGRGRSSEDIALTVMDVDNSFLLMAVPVIADYSVTSDRLTHEYGVGILMRADRRSDNARVWAVKPKAGRDRFPRIDEGYMHRPVVPTREVFDQIQATVEDLNSRLLLARYFPRPVVQSIPQSAS